MHDIRSSRTDWGFDPGAWKIDGSGQAVGSDLQLALFGERTSPRRLFDLSLKIRFGVNARDSIDSLNFEIVSAS